MHGDNRKWIAGAFLFVSLAIGCAVASKPVSAATLGEIKARGKLIAGVKSDFKPFGYLDASGKHIGFDVDIARLFAKALLGDENKVELVPVTSAARIPYLQTNKIDLVIATMAINEDRKKQVDFSEPYFLSGGLLLVSKNSSITGVTDLVGKTVAVLHGALEDGDMGDLAPRAERVRFDKVNEAVFALREGQADVFAFSDILVLTMANESTDVKSVGDPWCPRPYGIAVRKGEAEFVDWINEQLAALRDDGTYDQLWKKHFGEVETKLMRLKPLAVGKPVQANPGHEPQKDVVQPKPAARKP